MVQKSVIIPFACSFVDHFEKSERTVHIQTSLFPDGTVVSIVMGGWKPSEVPIVVSKVQIFFSNVPWGKFPLNWSLLNPFKNSTAVTTRLSFSTLNLGLSLSYIRFFRS